MQKHIFIAILAFLAALATSAVMAQAYRWTDAEGVVHYSDRPTEGAEQVQLPESNTVARSNTRSAPTGPVELGDTGDEEQPFAYDSIEIRAPASEETLWNIGGVLDVSISVQPALQPGHQMRIYFDGASQMVTGMSFQIEDVYRGEHNIQAEIVDGNGLLMARSQPSRFYVQQTTINR